MWCLKIRTRNQRTTFPHLIFEQSKTWSDTDPFSSLPFCNAEAQFPRNAQCNFCCTIDLTDHITKSARPSHPKNNRVECSSATSQTKVNITGKITTNQAKTMAPSSSRRMMARVRTGEATATIHTPTFFPRRGHDGFVWGHAVPARQSSLPGGLKVQLQTISARAAVAHPLNRGGRLLPPPRLARHPDATME